MSVKIQSFFLKQAFWLLFFNKNENIFGEINEDRCKVLRSSEKLIKIGLRRKIEGNVKVPMGSETREADIVVYADDAKSQPYMFYVGKRRLSVAIDRGRSLAETVANLAERACDFDVRHLNIRDVLVADLIDSATVSRLLFSLHLYIFHMAYPITITIAVGNPKVEKMFMISVVTIGFMCFWLVFNVVETP